MNGNGEGMQALPGLAMGNPIVDLLNGVLQDAKAGRISSIAIVAVTPQHGVATPYVGGQLGDMFIGASLLKAELFDKIRTPPKSSPIIRGVLAG
jgi:hypothetical protein